MQCGCMSSKKPSTAAAAAAAPAARWFKLLPRKEEEPVEKAIRRGEKDSLLQLLLSLLTHRL